MPQQLVTQSCIPLPGIRIPTLLCSDEEETVTYIGELYNLSKSSNEFCGIVQALTSAQKYIVCLEITESLVKIMCFLKPILVVTTSFRHSDHAAR